MIDSSAGIWFTVTKKGPDSLAELVLDPHACATVMVRRRTPEVAFEPKEKEK